MSTELILKSAYVEVTNKCNLYCKHCYNESQNKHNTFLSMELLENLYKSMRDNKGRRIAISGGEPLLHPNIMGIMRCATEYQIETQIVTNGTLLHKYIDTINKNPYITIQVSVDGIGPTHDLLRGKGIFEAMNFNLSKLASRVKLAIKATNISQIESIIQYAIQKGAETVAFSPLCIQGRATENQDLQITGGQLMHVIDTVDRLADKYDKIIDVRKININYSQCPFTMLGKADISPRIDPKGNVYLCSMFTNPLFAVGNINEQELISIINSKRCENMLNFMRTFRDIVNCKQCLANDYCQKGCLAQYLNDLTLYHDNMCGVKKANVIEYISTKLNLEKQE